MKNGKLIIAVLGILALTSCNRVHYETQALESIKTRPKVEEKVKVLYKPLSKKESIKYLGRVWQNYGYQPVQIAVENFSTNTINFSRRGIALPTADYETIKTKAHQYTRATAIGVGASSATCVTIGLVGLLLAPATFGISGILVPIGLGGAGLHTASKMMQSDVSLDKDYEAKFLHDKAIEANGVIEGIVFIPLERFQESFVVKIVDPKAEKPLLVHAKRFRG
jgi:hypothetical protein